MTKAKKKAEPEDGPLYDVVAEAQAVLDASEFDKAWEWIEIRRSVLQDLVQLARRAQ